MGWNGSELGGAGVSAFRRGLLNIGATFDIFLLEVDVPVLLLCSCSKTRKLSQDRNSRSNLNPIWLRLYHHHDNMTESSTHQTISVQGSYSPTIQREVSLGNKEYALKNYEKAVEHYGSASELLYPQSPSPSLTQNARIRRRRP
jgi:hypothetical protein